MRVSSSRKRLELIVELERALAADAEHVVRVVDIRHVLKGLGAILSHSRGDQASYDLSRPAGTIPVFVSHTWASARWRKTLALATYFNGTLAFALSIACLFITVISHLLADRMDQCDDIATRLNATAAERYEDAAVVASVPLVAGLVYAAVILWAHLIPGVRGRACFLDKICIHQTDARLKKEAIDSLDIFLRFSRRLLVLWSPDYLSRLWCVYELATFVKLHPDGASRIDFMPYWHSNLLFSINLLLTLSTLIMPFVLTAPTYDYFAHGLASPFYSFIVVFFSVVAVVSILGTIFLHDKVSEYSHMLRELRGFRLTDASCADPRDAELVHGLIEVMWSSSSEAGDGEQRFEEFVRRELAPQIEAKWGARWRLTYRAQLEGWLPVFALCVAVGLMCDARMIMLWGFTENFDDLHSQTDAGGGLGLRKWFWHWVLLGLEMWAFVNPLSMTLAQYVLARLVDAGCGALVCIAMGSIIYTAGFFVLTMAISKATLYRVVSHPEYAPVFVLVACVLLVVLVWRPPARLARDAQRRYLGPGRAQTRSCRPEPEDFNVDSVARLRC